MGWKDAPVVSGSAGGSWQDAPVEPFLDRAGRYVRGALKTAGQGLTLGFADEIGAAMDATIPGFGRELISNVRPVSQAENWQQRYDENLARERGEVKQFAEQNPKAAVAANLAGSVGGAYALSAAPVVGAVFRGSPGLTGNVLKGAAGGGALGGAQGFGEGEGGLDNRMSGAQKGAMVGTALGAGIPLAGAMIGYGYQKAAPWLLRRVADSADNIAPKAPPASLSAAAPEGGSVTTDSWAATIADKSRAAATSIEDDAAVKRLALEIARSGGTGKIKGRLDELGDGAFIADASKGTSRLANVGAMLPGEAGEKYAAAFGQRNKETGKRFLGAMGDEAKVPSVHDARRLLEARRTTEVPVTPFGESAAGIYGRARDAGLNISPEMQRLLDENQIVRQAFDRVTRENAATRLGTDRAPLDPVTLMHQTKQAIVDIATAATTGGSPTQPAYRALADDFVQAFKEANPAVRAADARYREMKSLYDNVSGEGWLTHGQNFMRTGTSDAATEVSPSALAEYIPRLTPEQLQVFRVGSSNTMKDAAASGPEATRRLAKAISDNEIMQQKLTEIYGPEVADRLMRRSAAERTFAETQGRVLGGSQTAERTAAIADDVALSIPQGGPTTPASLIQALANTYNKAREPSEAVRSRLADLLANPDPAANAETLRLIDALLRRQGGARPVGAGVAGAAGGNFSSPR